MLQRKDNEKLSLAQAYPALAAEWHPLKNGDLTPDTVSSGSTKRVWWMKPYNDPVTGKHFDFEWKAMVRSRALYGACCPYLSGHKIWPGYNDLWTSHPKLAAEWHPTKNGDLTPYMVSAGSNKKVWWMKSYEDSVTGKHFYFEWEAVISDRALQKKGCPYLSGHKVWPGYNDLQTTHPKVAAEWHPTKNGDLTPDKLSARSKKKVWWMKPYDDPVTGKHFNFEWEAVISDRALRKFDCPYLSGHKIWPGYNDLQTTHPKVAAEWHPTKNGDLTPDKLSAGSTMEVWWKKSYDDLNTGKHFNFEWRSVVYSRTFGKQGCPYLSGHKVWPGYNDLQTTHPKIAAEWHPTKNGGLTPDKVTAGSNKKVWWKKSYDDPITGMHFNFEWEEMVSNRALKKNGCPYLSGQKAWSGFNDLKTIQPNVAAEWHPTKNGRLTPDMVTVGSKKKVWWMKSYDDPVTGKHFDFEWRASINTRTSGKTGCPYLSGQKVWPGYNDLQTTHPKIAAEWHPTKNSGLTPDKVTAGSNKKVWWMKSYSDPFTGKHFNFEWEAKVNARALKKTDCPYLSGKKVWSGYNDLKTTHPKVAAEWHPTKNGGLLPNMVTAGSYYKAWWKRPYDDPVTGKHFDFEWRASVYSRTLGKLGCPYISGQKVWPGYNDLQTTHPKIAAEWHPEKNGDLTPDMVTAGSKKKVWWMKSYDDPVTGKHFDFEWRASINTRTFGKAGCPYLSGQKVLPGFNDLMTTHPDVAVSWHPSKNKSLTPTMVSSGSTKRAWWMRPYDDPVTGKHFDFEWDTPIEKRTRDGYECPYLNNLRVWTGYNDLATRHPDVAEEWHPYRNRQKAPDKILFCSSRKVWWKCKKCGHEWIAPIIGRTLKGSECPKCQKKRRKYGEDG